MEINLSLDRSRIKDAGSLIRRRSEWMERWGFSRCYLQEKGLINIIIRLHDYSIIIVLTDTLYYKSMSCFFPHVIKLGYVNAKILTNIWNVMIDSWDWHDDIHPAPNDTTGTRWRRLFCLHVCTVAGSGDVSLPVSTHHHVSIHKPMLHHGAALRAPVPWGGSGGRAVALS